MSKLKRCISRHWTGRRSLPRRRSVSVNSTFAAACSTPGQADRCYREVFDIKHGDTEAAARRLVHNPAVMARIRELGTEMISETESIAVKMQISRTLRNILEETATGIYRDRFGNPLSPAPLRAVAVNAAKALMEMYPVKNGGEAKFKIEGSDNNIVFNVIVPRMENTPTHDEG